MTELKEVAYSLVLSMLDKKINEAEQAVANIKESRDNETKSSAGDKHETGRAMSQIELDNSEMHLGKILNQKRQFLQLDFMKKSNRIEPGCLVITNRELYFISIGLGRIPLEKMTCYAISLQSPIGKALENKKVGDLVSFQNRDIEIKEIL